MEELALIGISKAIKYISALTGSSVEYDDLKKIFVNSYSSGQMKKLYFQLLKHKRRKEIVKLLVTIEQLKEDIQKKPENIELTWNVLAHIPTEIKQILNLWRTFNRKFVFKSMVVEERGSHPRVIDRRGVRW